MIIIQRAVLAIVSLLFLTLGVCCLVDLNPHLGNGNVMAGYLVTFIIIAAIGFHEGDDD